MNDFDWLQKLLSSISEHKLNIAVNEFGIHRWAKGNSKYVEDLFDIFEYNGWNHALWMWYPISYPEDMNEFNFLVGSNPENTKKKQSQTA